MNQELSYVPHLEKAEEPEIKLSTSTGSLKKQESSRKTSISALLTRPTLDCVDHNKLWKILQEMGMPDHLTCLLRNLYAEYTMWNDGLDEAQAGIKIAGRIINNLRYADDTTLMAES